LAQEILLEALTELHKEKEIRICASHLEQMGWLAHEV